LNYDKEINILTEELKRIYRDSHATRNMKVQDKTNFDLVTSVDLFIETELIKSIQSHFPGDSILSEEFHNTTELSGRTWTIDPIDGTVNMANNLSNFGLQIALFLDEEVVLSMIYLPFRRTLFHAVKGKGAFQNGKRLSVEKREASKSIISFGDFTHKREEDRLLELDIMTYASNKVSKIRMFGAASLDFAYAASSRTDGLVIFTKNLWDIAPGILLCKEAGAHILNLDRQPYQFGDRAVVIVNNLDLIDSILQ
jgi:myo-inositol-1(or 4)-monophosphatase